VVERGRLRDQRGREVVDVLGGALEGGRQLPEEREHHDAEDHDQHGALADEAAERGLHDVGGTTGAVRPVAGGGAGGRGFPDAHRAAPCVVCARRAILAARRVARISAIASLLLRMPTTASGTSVSRNSTSEIAEA